VISAGRLFSIAAKFIISLAYVKLGRPIYSLNAYVDKAATLGFSLINNHPFIDGNKRIGHAAMEVFLILNGYEIEAEVDEQERIILEVAAGQVKRDGLKEWLSLHIVERKRE
jgi:death-on-curing family protein